jgi:hypothetical protein
LATAPNIQKAEALTRIGIAVFPVYVHPDPENPFRTTKKPGTPNGFYDATKDPGYVYDLFEKHPKAEVGVWMGESGLVAADIDVKRDPEGNILIDGFEEFDRAWLDLPPTFDFESISGAGGKQFIYAAPEGVRLGPDGNYRGIKGVDRRGGGSYSVWAGDVPTSRDVFAPAPEWLLDEKSVRSAAAFEGDVREWYDSLEPGEPNVLVRGAMERARKKYEQGGEDFDHAAIIERQYEAVRLGAEGNPGVEVLLAYLEDLFLSRTGSHSRPEEEWAHEFAEGLHSGIQKHGASIALRKNLPPYSPADLPDSVPDRLIAGDPGTKETFSELLRIILPLISDDYKVLSILWNSPRTRDMAREWGLEFVYQRILDARLRPEPVRENPTLPDASNVVNTADENRVVTDTFLSAEELERVRARRTFIDKYLEATASKGFYNYAYAMPAAWTAMSMAFGGKAFIPKGVNIGVNLWHLVLGESGTGKTAEDEFLTDLLDTMLKDGEGFYNLGAHSSPEGLHEALLERDGQASIIHHDEASDFFEALKTKDWMRSLKDLFAKWYVGRVDPMQKVRLKELRGKSARTSFNIHMIATPDRLTGFLDTSMFASGFLARFNWLWAEDPVDDDRKYRATLSETDEQHMVNPAVFALAGDLMEAATALGDTPVKVRATTEAIRRLEQAFRDFDMRAKKHEKYEVIEPAITRLGRETIWKCAALMALHDGRSEIQMIDALIAIRYAQEWFWALQRVVDTTSEGEFSREVAQIEAFIRSKPGVSKVQLLHRFRALIKYSPRELDDKFDFLVTSGRVNRHVLDGGKRIIYEVNGSQ